jgi:hypothetical protein
MENKIGLRLASGRLCVYEVGPRNLNIGHVTGCDGGPIEICRCPNISVPEVAVIEQWLIRSGVLNPHDVIAELYAMARWESVRLH